MIPMATQWHSGPTLENITGVVVNLFCSCSSEKLEPNKTQKLQRSTTFTMTEISKAEVIKFPLKY